MDKVPSSVRKEFDIALNLVMKSVQVSLDEEGVVVDGSPPERYTISAFLVSDYYDVSLSWMVHALKQGERHSYTLLIMNKQGAYHHTGDKEIESDLGIEDFSSWIESELHTHNLKKQSDVFQYYFEDRPCAIIDLHSDPLSNYLVFQDVLRGHKEYDDEVFLFRIRSNIQGIIYNSYAMQFPAKKYFFDHSFWLFFPKLESPDKKRDGYCYQIRQNIQALFAELNGKMGVEVIDIDIDWQIFKAKLERKATLGSRTECLGPYLVDVILSSVVLPDDIMKLYIEDLGKIDSEIDDCDVDNALRNLRALIQSSGEYLLRKRGIRYKEKANLSDIGGSLAKGEIIDGRLVLWFKAFHDFSSQHSHLVSCPTNQTKDIRLDTWSYNTINIGKQLLLELWLIISDFPSTIRGEYMDTILPYTHQFDLIKDQKRAICRISYHGKNKKAQINIRKEALSFFSSMYRDIELEIEGTTYFTHLPDSFFDNCPHLRTAYDKSDMKGVNRLNEWASQTDSDLVLLEVITEGQRYKLVNLKKFDDVLYSIMEKGV